MTYRIHAARIIGEVLLPRLEPTPERQQAIAALVLKLAAAEHALGEERRAGDSAVEAVYPELIVWLKDADAVAAVVTRLRSAMRDGGDVPASVAVDIAMRWLQDERSRAEMPSELLRDLASALVDPADRNAARALDCLHRIYVEGGVAYGPRAWDLLTRLHRLCRDADKLRANEAVLAPARALAASLATHFRGSPWAEEMLADIQRVIQEQHPEQTA